MTRLSVNINKIATLRNARGGNTPDVALAAQRCEDFGAEGITVHPRPDQRHIRYSDVRQIRPLVRTEFNMEGNPIPEFMALALEVRPDQVTLVPDGHDAITSDAGWDVAANADFLRGICKTLRDNGIRSSIFVWPDAAAVRAAKAVGADRVELYTAHYAADFPASPEKAIAPYLEAAKAAKECGLGLNAGHDLSLENLSYFIRTIPWTDEVSIGHALISDTLYMGLEKTIAAYLSQIRNF